MSVADALSSLAELEVVELGHPLQSDTVCSPTQPGFRTALLHRHGDHTWPDGTSAAFEMLVMGTHVGTHVDAACHVSVHGLLHGGARADLVSASSGYPTGSVDLLTPFIGRGILLDLTAESPDGVLAAGREIGVSDLERAVDRTGARPGAGDVVCLRTGWSRYFRDGERYSGRSGGAPGVGAEAAGWLAALGVHAVGADVMAFETVPVDGVLPGLEAHRVLLVNHDINILENLALEDLAACGVAEFVFLALPLRIVGGTGSPIRPVALLQRRRLDERGG